MLLAGVAVGMRHPAPSTTTADPVRLDRAGSAVRASLLALITPYQLCQADLRNEHPRASPLLHFLLATEGSLSAICEQWFALFHQWCESLAQSRALLVATRDAFDACR